mgnify:CR=1 FL=1
MGISVSAESTPDGWVLKTFDEFKDVVAGPVDSRNELNKLASELDLVIAGRSQRRVGDLNIGTLFRVGTNWYRILAFSGRNASVDVVGESRTDNLKKYLEVTEISVLSLR